MIRRLVLIAAAMAMLSGCIVYERDYVDRGHHHHHYDDRYGWR
ncbi:MAG TPA: hypothetical protein VL966_08265 [Alphaproteobacteria bacterium]|jgi:hypothetical protein|nr:hypothetical protein [Alphaproteobacteria bacterium]